MRRFVIVLAGLVAAPGAASGGEGDQDLTFGTAGVLAFNAGGTYDELTQIALQTDGKIIGVGRGQSNRFTVARFLPTGQADTTFGVSGKRVIDNSTSTGAVHVLPDDRILLAHTRNSLFGVSILTPDGDFDSSFSNDGFEGIQIPNANFSLGAVAVDNQGRYVACGGGYDPDTDYDFVVARFLPTGERDWSFSHDGIQQIDFTRPELATAREFALSLVIRPDGTIVLGGHATETPDVSSGNRIYALVQLTPEGELDESFGDGGKMIFTLGTVFAESEAISDMILLPDGKIIASSSWGSYKALLKFNTNGSLDETWGDGGVIYSDAADDIRNVYDIELDGAGRILAACDKTGWAGVARFYPDGSLDQTFNRPNLESAQCLVQQPGGGIIVGGKFWVANVSGEWQLRRVESRIAPCSIADVTTVPADENDPAYGIPDGAVTAADIQYYVNAWIARDPVIADLTTQNAPAGDPGYGVPDGLVTAVDIQYYVNIWVAGCP